MVWVLTAQLFLDISKIQESPLTNTRKRAIRKEDGTMCICGSRNCSECGPSYASMSNEQLAQYDASMGDLFSVYREILEERKNRKPLTKADIEKRHEESRDEFILSSGKITAGIVYKELEKIETEADIEKLEEVVRNKFRTGGEFEWLGKIRAEEIIKNLHQVYLKHLKINRERKK